MGDTLASFIFSFAVAEDEHSPRSLKIQPAPDPHGRRQMLQDFLGTHSRVAERTRLFPVREDSGKYLGGWADLALGGTSQEHTI